jgi:hypothetical protein
VRGFILKFLDKSIKMLSVTVLEPLKILIGYLGRGYPVVFKL